MTTFRRKPAWLKVRLPAGETCGQVGRILRERNLHTVCQSAHCPNQGECWREGTATFMILGDVCTRNCGFCAVTPGEPAPVDPDEPKRVAEAARLMGLKHVVITSVTRDDLSDGGAAIWVATVGEVRQASPAATVETLIPDFQGSAAALGVVLDARPDILNHNLETVPRLYPTVRPQADYRQSLEVLRQSSETGLTTKTGLMLGLSETDEEIASVLSDCRTAGVSILTLGQYLQPSSANVPVHEYITPDAFTAWRTRALSLGFTHVESAPLVRSSYHAERALEG